MSSLANWTYVYLVTIWPVTYDDNSQAVYGTPYTIMADWGVAGAAQTSINGEQFVPQSYYYFEAADGDISIPKIDYMIFRGDHTATADPSTLDAEKIKLVKGWGMDAFGAGELPDWGIFT
ncbi:MAG: hypothetical protein V4440_05390 [Pseudomonadota bacterium]